MVVFAKWTEPLEAAERLNIGVFTSIPLFQSRLLNAKIPDYAGLTGQVEKLVQIIRSTPSVIYPLIGQMKPQLVQQNIKIATVPPMSNLKYKEAIQKIFKTNLWCQSIQCHYYNQLSDYTAIYVEIRFEHNMHSYKDEILLLALTLHI